MDEINAKEFQDVLDAHHALEVVRDGYDVSIDFSDRYANWIGTMQVKNNTVTYYQTYFFAEWKKTKQEKENA